MSNVFEAGSDRRLVIYGISHYIFLRTAYVDGVERPIILAADYVDSLTEAVWGDTIYYAYRSQNRDIVVKNIMNTGSLYVIHANENPDIYSPKLVSLNERLFLFYETVNPLSNTSELRCVLPCEGGTPVPVPSDVNASHVHKSAAETSSELAAASASKSSADGGSCIEIIKAGKSIYIFANIVYRMTDVGEYQRFELSYSCAKKINEYENRIRELEGVLESVKHQYEELMETAVAYRDEAVKWRGKFM